MHKLNLHTHLLIARSSVVLTLAAALLIPACARANSATDISAVPVPHTRLSGLVTGWLGDWLNAYGPGAAPPKDGGPGDDGWHSVYSNAGILDQVSLCGGTLHDKANTWTVDFGTAPDVINREIAILHDNGVQAMFLMSNDGDVHSLMANPAQQAFAIDSIVKTLDTYNLDGVDLDIEDFVDTDHADTQRYTAFVEALTSRLHQRPDSFGFPTTVVPTVIVRSDASQWAYADETVLANTEVNSIRVMVYDENYDGSPEAGATAPLPWMHQVSDYLRSRDAPTWKFLIGLPGYGYDWPVNSATDWKTTATGDSISYNQAMTAMATNHVDRQWSASDQAPYYSYQKAGKTRVAFYEDAPSWDLKLSQIVAPTDAAAQSKPFGGFSEWAFGLEDPGVWPEVRQRLAVAYPIYGVIGECYAHQGGGARFGAPLAAEEDAGKPQLDTMNARAGRMQRFANASVYYQWGKPRAYSVMGDLLRQYDAKGGPSGALGFPIADPATDPTGQTFVQFENGSLSEPAPTKQ